ncbi:NnrS family protein [Azospirillum sp.]|uniref:NnrS family protein n=1 Tax=Azospirillum sp. TaxID=34012 RepID=UPI002D3489D4|nr:NnrS family protein [Azospirillum sp.]HYF90136.1 NnrS family protein [Azospirillum sp.]
MAGPGSDAGLRPLVLCGTLYAAGLVAAWVPWFLGFISLDVEFSPVAWHAHELLFGFAPAVIAGFLPVTGPNRNGRQPSLGIAAWLFAAWVAGRLGVAASATLGPPATAMLTLLFPLSLAAMAGRTIPVGSLRVLTLHGALCLLTGAQILFHWELWRYGQSICGTRLAVAAMAAPVMLSGNVALASPAGFDPHRNPGKTHGVAPAPCIFPRFDGLAAGFGLLALAAWVVQGSGRMDGKASGTLLLAAGLALAVQVVRRWQGIGGPFLFIASVTRAFVPAGFLFAAGASFTASPAYARAALHAWTAAAIGGMMLAAAARPEPTRAALWLTIVIHAAVMTAAVARIAAAFAPQNTMLLMPLSGTAWIIAFLLFGIAGSRTTQTGPHPREPASTEPGQDQSGRDG